MMRITLINLWDKGGMIHYSSQLANALAKTEEVTVIIPTGAGLKYFNESVIVKTVSVPTEFSLKELCLFPFKLIKLPSFLKIVRDTKPDVIHINSGHPWLILAMPFLKKYKIFVTLHDPEPHAGEKSLRKYLSIQMSIRYATKIFVHGKATKNFFVNKVSENKIEIIPHGDYSFFTKWKDDSVHEELSVLFFGRILDYKGIQYLLQAEPLVTKEVENTKIIIAGTGDFQKYKKYIQNDMNLEIINEFIPDEKVASLFQRCAIVVLPYTEGSQSGIIPIAYSFKKPVIATNVGCIPEVVEEERTGYIVEPRNSKALAEKIIRLLKDDDLRKQMGKNAYIKMKEELSWDKIAEKTIEVYIDVINSEMCEEDLNWRERMKDHIRWVLHKTIGTPNIVRIIEWQRLFEYLNPKEGENILDVACGVGELSLKIAERGCKVHGVDSSKVTIKKAKRLAKREKIACEFEVGNAEDLPYPDGYFDKVVFSSSLEHIGDDMKALKDAYRVLKPNGSIVLTVPSLTYLISNEIKEKHRKIAYVVNYYTRETLKKKFAMTGFSMVRSKYLLNSCITTFFCKIGIKLRWSGLWVGMFPLAYLCVISDKLFGVEDKGYTLIAEGEKS